MIEEDILQREKLVCTISIYYYKNIYNLPDIILRNKYIENRFNKTMKTFVLVICLLVASFTGCLDVLDDNEKPIAKIENRKDFYEITCKNGNLKLNGTGHDSDGIIWGYEWKSNLDGVIGTEQNITISGLSKGNHTISFSVKDDKGKWSDLSNTKLNVEHYLCGKYTMFVKQKQIGNWTVHMMSTIPSLSHFDIGWHVLDTNQSRVSSGNLSVLTKDSAGISLAYGDEDCNQLIPGCAFKLVTGEGIFYDHENLESYVFYLTYIPTGETLGFPIKLQV